MSETLGTLTLKIARLEQHLKVLEQQWAMSSLYPDHKAALSLECAKVRRELGRLTRMRQEMTPLAKAA